MRSLASPGCPRPPGAILWGGLVYGLVEELYPPGGFASRVSLSPGENSAFMVSGPLRTRLAEEVCSAEPQGPVLVPVWY